MRSKENLVETIFSLSPEDQNKLTIEEAKFIFEQAEKTLKEIGELSKELAGRSTNVIAIVSGALIGIVAYAFARLHSTQEIDAAIITCFLITLYLNYLAYKLITNFKGQDYFPLGTDPYRLMSNSFLKAPDNDTRKLWFYLSEIQRSQGKISFNRKKNNERWNKFNSVLMQLAFTPLIAFVVYALAVIFFQNRYLLLF